MSLSRDERSRDRVRDQSTQRNCETVGKKGAEEVLQRLCGPGVCWGYCLMMFVSSVDLAAAASDLSASLIIRAVSSALRIFHTSSLSLSLSASVVFKQGLFPLFFFSGPQVPEQIREIHASKRGRRLSLLFALGAVMCACVCVWRRADSMTD